MKRIALVLIASLFVFDISKAPKVGPEAPSVDVLWGPPPGQSRMLLGGAARGLAAKASGQIRGVRDLGRGARHVAFKPGISTPLHHEHAFQSRRQNEFRELRDHGGRVPRERVAGWGFSNNPRLVEAEALRSRFTRQLSDIETRLQNLDDSSVEELRNKLQKELDDVREQLALAEIMEAQEAALGNNPGELFGHEDFVTQGFASPGYGPVYGRLQKGVAPQEGFRVAGPESRPQTPFESDVDQQRGRLWGDPPQRPTSPPSREVLQVIVPSEIPPPSRGRGLTGERQRMGWPSERSY